MKVKKNKMYEITPEDRQWMLEKQAEYDRLNQHIQRVCQTYSSSMMSSSNNSSHHFQGHNIMIDHWHKVAYCRNAKVGTSTWMHHFSLLDPKHRFVHSKGDLHSRIPFLFSITKQIYKRSSLRQFRQANNSWFFNHFLKKNHYLTFTFIRHPFDRLVSAFMDKVERSKKSWGHQMLLRKYGKSDFETFLDYVINENAHHNSNAVNNHWKKFQDRCGFCTLKYDVIGRMESFDEDTRYIFLKANLIQEIPLELSELAVHQTKKKSRSKGDKSPSNRTLTYFANVSQAMIQSIYQVYKIDFELFEYNLQGLI